MNKLVYQNSVKFGIILGFSCFLFFFILNYVGMVSYYFKMADIGIMVILIWASIWYYKRNMGGILHFYEAFSIGFLTNVIGAFTSGLLIFLYVKFVDFQPFTQWVLESKTTLLQNKTGDLKDVYTETEFQAQLNAMDALKPSAIFFDSLFKKTIAGILPIGLLSMVMRKIKI